MTPQRSEGHDAALTGTSHHTPTQRHYAGQIVQVYKYADCGSTNEEAVKRVEHSDVPVVLSAEYQTQGRGRRARTWHGARGLNLYISIALPQPRWTTYYSDYQFAACLAVYDTVLEYAMADDVRIKYPNDILVRWQTEFAKVAGILVETEFRGAELQNCVCGIGVNVNQDDYTGIVDQAATSLSILTGRTLSIDAVRESVVTNFFECLLKGSDDVFERWNRLVNLRDKTLRIADTAEMVRVLEVQRDGMLRIQTSSGEVRRMDQSYSFRLYDDEEDGR